jgi:uncharacterized damage-inducible protein DinB
MPQTVLRDEFCSYAATKLRDGLRQIEKCLALLSVEQVWSRPNAVSNAIGNLVLHLNGNVRLWIVKSIGGVEFTRDRAAEFAQRQALPIETILPPLQRTVEQACQVIEGLSPERLRERLAIQGYDVSVLAAVFHVVEHFALHTGQIIYQTKILSGFDLNLYDAQGRRLDGRQQGVP